MDFAKKINFRWLISNLTKIDFTFEINLIEKYLNAKLA